MSFCYTILRKRIFFAARPNVSLLKQIALMVVANQDPNPNVELTSDQQQRLLNVFLNYKTSGF